MEKQLDNTLKKAVAEPNIVVWNYCMVYKHVQTGAVYSSQRIKNLFQSTEYGYYFDWDGPRELGFTWIAYA